MANELKPCPFCGGKPYLEQRHRAFVKGQSTRVALVRCTECEARTQKFDLRDFGHTSISREANLKAIEAWNMRAVDAAPVVHGRWVKDGEVVVCSECGAEHAWEEYRATYCEDCGAKMDGGNEDG